MAAYKLLRWTCLTFLQITLFGQSAGATSIADLYFNAGLEDYGVRGAVSIDSISFPDDSLRQYGRSWNQDPPGLSRC